RARPRARSRALRPRAPTTRRLRAPRPSALPRSARRRPIARPPRQRRMAHPPRPRRRLLHQSQMLLSHSGLRRRTRPRSHPPHAPHALPAPPAPPALREDLTAKDAKHAKKREFGFRTYFFF